MFKINKSKSKKIIFFSLAIILTIASLPIFSAFEAHVINVTATIDNPVQVLTPNGGEVFSIGKCHPIKWTVDERLPRPGNINSIDLYYSTNGGITYPEENKITNISSVVNGDKINSYCFNWLVPNDPTDQGRMMALIDYADPEIPDQVDYSDENFDITYAATANDNTVALWHFNENSGNIASDETGNNDGTLMPNYSSNSPTWTSGKVGSALSFDGIDDYVSVSPSGIDFYGKDEITVEAWVYPKSFQQDPDHSTIVTKAHQYYFHIDGNGYLQIYIYGVSPAGYHSSNNPIPLNQWTNVAFTYKNSEGFKIYINSLLDKSIPASNSIGGGVTDYLGIGANLDSSGNLYPGCHQKFNGIIDEVRISDIARDFNIDCDNSECENGGGDSPPVPPEEGDVVINEIMWMGSEGDPHDEWIELRNITDNEISLDDCILTKKKDAEDEEIADLTGLTILPESSNGYLVISRKDRENSKIDVDTQDILAYQALSNSQLQIKLICDNTEIDLAGDGDKPLAGNNTGTPKKSMTRKYPPGDGTLAENWCDATTQINWDLGATDFGTPGAANSSCLE